MFKRIQNPLRWSPTRPPAPGTAAASLHRASRLVSVFGALAFVVSTTPWLGCTNLPMAGPETPQVVVTEDSDPVPVPSLPPVNPVRIERALVPMEAASLKSEEERRFIEAREAFWSRNTPTAERLLRESLLNPTNAQRVTYLQHLIVASAKEDRNWTRALAHLEEFQRTGEDSDGVAQIRFMASQPAMEIRAETAPEKVPFELRRGLIVTALAHINGAECRVMLDTGFTHTFVIESFAQRQGIDVLDLTLPMLDANGSSRPIRHALLHEVRLGGLHARNVTAVCGSSDFLRSTVGADIVAVIGWDLLQHLDIVWDFPARWMTLGAPESRDPNLPPALSGRKFPIISVTSPDGRPLDLFLDTGHAPNPHMVGLFKNAGLLWSKLDRSRARRSVKPSFERGLNSFRIRWPRRIRPFHFTFSGSTFELPLATVYPTIDVREGFQTCDGVVGNAPFLRGRLRLCGVSRFAEYQPSDATGPVP